MIFGAKKIKTTRDVFDKKPFNTGKPAVTAPALQFLQVKKQKMV